MSFTKYAIIKKVAYNEFLNNNNENILGLYVKRVTENKNHRVINSAISEIEQFQSTDLKECEQFYKDFIKKYSELDIIKEEYNSKQESLLDKQSLSIYKALDNLFFNQSLTESVIDIANAFKNVVELTLESNKLKNLPSDQELENIINEKRFLISYNQLSESEKQIYNRLVSLSDEDKIKELVALKTALIEDFSTKINLLTESEDKEKYNQVIQGINKVYSDESRTINDKLIALYNLVY